MLRALSFLCLFSLSGFAAPPTVKATPTRADALETPSLPPTSGCITFQGRVRYSLGYDHLVDVKNGCPAAVTCAVTTNVNPEPITVSLKPTESSTVVTFIGSPAREFEPRVVCQYVT